MYWRKIFQIFLFTVLAFNFQTARANITGKVTNQGGKGIANAVCTLVVKGAKTTTGADGSFTLNTTGVSQNRSLQPRSSSITLSGSVMEFCLNSPSAVRIEVFNAQGALLKKETQHELQPGLYRLNVAEYSRTSELLVIRAKIGADVTMFHYIPLGKGKLPVNTPGSVSGQANGPIAKITAVIDTMKVSAANYLSKSVLITSYDTSVNITLDSVSGSAVTVRLDQTRQVIHGFGINNNWKPLGTNGINACFDSVNGLGLSILRIGMFSSGDLFQSNNWDDVKNAKAKGCKYIIGSTWSPPANWKTNNSENDGGYLKTEYYSQWADRIVAFASKVKQNSGVDLYAMSIGNEPDFASCGMQEPCNGNYPTTLYTAEQMVAFIKVVGPKMRTAAPNCKIIAPEASEWIHTWSDTSGCCSVPSGKPSSDPLKCGCFQGKTTPCSCAPGKGYSYGKYLYEDKTAWSYVDILGVHQYDTQRAEPWPDYVAVADRKPVWQTEMSGVKWWPEGSPSTTIENGIAVAGWIHDALTVGELNAWCYWWYNGGSGTNEGLLLDGKDTKRHYTFGNYTRYVRPGMIRVVITGNIPANVLLTAFKGTGNTVVIVAINKSDTQVTIPITIAGGTAPSSFIPYVTSGAASENWAAKTAVTVSNNILTVTLGGKTVTTFVGK